MSGILILFALPMVFFLVLDALIFRKPPAWLSAAVERVWARLRPPQPVRYDPFDALEVQHRLAWLTAEIQQLEVDHRVFARAHRIRVAQSAYDAVLGEACRLAGVPIREVSEVEIRATGERERGELELASRGWFW